jgi:N6-adenosine-specific RNA methylase IME4
MSEWPFGDNLHPFCADLILADPPWAFKSRSAKGEKKSAQAQYDCMSLGEIMAMPVNHLAKPDCWLFLWVTAPMLPQGLGVLRAWGFDYVTTLAWHKVFPSGKTAMGTGYVARTMHENILVGKIGAPRFSKALPSFFAGVRREHSRKPEDIYRLLERFAPDAWRVDLFSRERRDGWMAFGNEADKFNREETAA